MARREPDGETDVEVLAAEIVALRKRLADLEAFVAGKLPHNHDGRYVNEAGDTMTGTLTVESNIIAERTDSNGDVWQMVVGKQVSPSDPLRIEIRKNGSYHRHISFRVDKNAWFFNGDVEMDDALTVNGAKNAEIVDPDDATKGWRFAAMEADEPGLLFHRLTVTIPTGGGEATVDLPEHWSRIATAGDAMVTPLNDTRDQAPAAAAVDLTVPEVTVRGKPGDYRVWVAAARADAGVDGWTHEVEVTPDEDV